MYPSINTTNINNDGNTCSPISYYRPSSLYDPSSSSSSCLFDLPSPYIHYEDDAVFLQHLHDLMLLQQQQPPSPPPPPPPPPPTLAADAVTLPEPPPSPPPPNMEEDDAKKLDGTAKRKMRTCKKDRHSKIDTAQGPRDRRMRLSLEVARKFFDLQDVLGFDKASKTVEWLLNKSRAAIKELSIIPHFGANYYSPSSTSECEVVSGIFEEDLHRKAVRSATKGENKKIRALTRKSAFRPLAKESREKARARARERTMEKRRLDESKLPMEAMNQLGSWSPFENCEEEESGSQSRSNNNSIIRHSIAELKELTSPPIFNYDHQNPGIAQEHQFRDSQVYGRSWEAYNN